MIRRKICLNPIEKSSKIRQKNDEKPMRLVITSAKNLYAICINHEGLIHIYYLSYTTTYVGSRSRLNKK